MSATLATEPATSNDATQLNQSQIYEEISETPNEGNGSVMVEENGSDDPNLVHTIHSVIYLAPEYLPTITPTQAPNFTGERSMGRHLLNPSKSGMKR